MLVMAKNIAQLMVDTLVQAGVERVYGLPGDSLSRWVYRLDSKTKKAAVDSCQA